MINKKQTPCKAKHIYNNENLTDYSLYLECSKSCIIYTVHDLIALHGTKSIKMQISFLLLIPLKIPV